MDVQKVRGPMLSPNSTRSYLCALKKVTESLWASGFLYVLRMVRISLLNSSQDYSDDFKSMWGCMINGKVHRAGRGAWMSCRLSFLGDWESQCPLHIGWTCLSDGLLQRRHLKISGFFFFLFGGELYFPLPLFGNYQIKWSITFLSFLKFFKSQLTI